YTLFLENDPKWINYIKDSNTNINIAPRDYYDRTVQGSMPIDEDELSKYELPEALASASWDVILVDSPVGDRPHKPGRSLSIYWASRVAKPHTQVFIDDYDRPLEKAYADYFLCSRRQWNIEI